jgi:hypothetical protein
MDINNGLAMREDRRTIATVREGGHVADRRCRFPFLGPPVFPGVWVGEAWVPAGNGTEVSKCIGFVIESVAPDARVRAKYVWGEQVKYHGNSIATKPGVRAWEGTMTGDVVHVVNPGGRRSFDFRVTGANELRGVYSSTEGAGAMPC